MKSFYDAITKDKKGFPDMREGPFCKTLRNQKRSDLMLLLQLFHYSFGNFAD
jgi:hypothetical protein